MATVVNFYGKNYIEPGSYAVSVYNPNSVVNLAEFGNVMIIDTGLSLSTVNGVASEFAGGAGVKGELSQGLKSVYEFDKFGDFYNFMGGGIAADIAQKIFTPRDGVAGAPKLLYVRAATTVGASIVLTMSTGNTLTLKCKNEGLCGNGITDLTETPESFTSLGQNVVAVGDWIKRNDVHVQVAAGDAEIGTTMETFEHHPAIHAADGVLKVGYSAKIIAGTTDSTKFKLQVYRGTFQGNDNAGEPIGAYTFAEAVPTLLVDSDEFATLGELYEWATANKVMLAHFSISKAGVATTPLVAISQTLATGGTTSFLNNGEYDEVLESITELDISFFLCTNLNAASGAGVSATSNGKLFTFLKQNAKYTEHMFVPGGEEDDDIFGDTNSSQAIAKHFDSDQVIVVHGAPIVPRKDGNGNKKLPAIYHTASIVGMNAGMTPQTPLTFKRVGYQSFAYDLKKKEREKALQAGIMHVRNVGGYWCINQGITTLQNNKQTISEDGQSFELSVSIIKAQLNKELIMEGERRFTGNTAAQSSPVSVKNFTQTKLASLVAKPGADNLIISWKNVNVSANNSDYTITYDFVPNIPVNKTFFVGNILDFKVNA